MNIPTLLTWLRIVLIPVFVVVFYLPIDSARAWTALIFILAAITDWLDGYLARLLNQTSALGAFLDPVADKLMVAMALVLLVQSDPTPWLAIPAAIIVCREIAVSALREWMAEIGARTRVAVSFVGKIKTTAQMFAIILLLFQNPFAGLPTHTIGLILLYVAAGLTLWSMIVYIHAAWPALTAEENNK
ncbi:MAG: CDP-diacylglycerol--glycerol-3-phosphate 3-phosphatidyltransferase [Gammaproteobacteria bacterium]|nr:CDP-diacylglycerol--glycerol-3-phosphate 3-phosphatidyltransferase [Gammaproteobacteria bacterium]